MDAMTSIAFVCVELPPSQMVLVYFILSRSLLFSYSRIFTLFYQELELMEVLQVKIITILSRMQFFSQIQLTPQLCLELPDQKKEEDFPY